jgi:hypothetical protein
VYPAAGHPAKPSIGALFDKMLQSAYGRNNIFFEKIETKKIVDNTTTKIIGFKFYLDTVA